MSHNDSLVVVRPAVARQETATNKSLRLVGGGCGEGGRTGARRTGAGASEPPTRHNGSLVVGTRRAGAREDPPTSVLLVGGGCEEGGTGLGRANHQRVITTCWWWLGQARTGVGESEPPTSHNNLLVAVGAGEDWGWGEKPPTSHNDSLVVGTRRAGAREAHQRVS